MFDRSSAWKCGLAVISVLFTSTVACAQSPVISSSVILAYA